MHLLIHFDNIDGLSYIRIVNTPNINSYNEEYKIVYGKDNITTNFYNCGDMSIRLLHDLEYKKFKNIQLTKVIDNIYKITNNTDVFQEEFIKYVNTKIDSYIEECDDNYFDISINTIFNSKYCESSYIKQQIIDYSESIKEYENLIIDFKYTLLFIEKLNDKYILSNTHLNSLVLKYINNNFFILRKDHKYDASDMEIIKINRGLLIPKIELTINDVEKIFETVGITIDALNAISLSKNYINSIDLNNTCDTKDNYGVYPNTLNDEKDVTFGPNAPNTLYAEYETWGAEIEQNHMIEIEKNHKALIDSINNPVGSKGFSAKTHVPYDTIEFMVGTEQNQQSIEELIASVNKSETQKPSKTKTVIYKNLLNQKLKTYDIDEFKYLNEIQKISTLNSSLNIEIFELINNSSISNDIIIELQTLLNIFKKEDSSDPEYIADNSGSRPLRPYFEIGTTGCNNSTFEQTKKTREYVDKYKNDSLETLASTVIDNVNKFLSQTIKDINKNQIGRDLVEFGLKKTRKSKGFVYGIEDTSNKFGTNALFPGLNKSSEIRSVPPNPVIKNCSPFNMSPHIF